MSVDDEQLINLRQHCIGEYGQVLRWPDGGALIDQPVKLMQAFNIIADTIERLKKG